MFHFTKAFGTISSHAMFFCEEAKTYIHVWDVETDSPTVKMNVIGTKRQQKIAGKKAAAYVAFVKTKI